jgi:hypothetical protein
LARLEGVGHRTISLGRHHEDRVVGKQEREKCPRGWIEQIDVVDAEHQPCTIASLPHLLPDPGEQRMRLSEIDPIRQQRREHRQGHRRRTLGRADVRHGMSLGPRVVQALLGKPALTDAGNAGHDHPVMMAVLESVDESLQLTPPANERPAGHRRRTQRRPPSLLR